jgi:Phage late-transcription coactivator
MTKLKLSDAYVITKQFTSASEFSQFIEKQAVQSKHGYMDVIIDFCQRNDIDVESISKLITRSLKEKIRVEATDKNLLTKKAAPKLL